MTDFPKALLGMFAALAPFGALLFVLASTQADGSATRLRVVLLACAATLIALLAAAAVADPFLDFLDISAESFQFAAGVVMAPLAIRLLLTGDSAPEPDHPGEGPIPRWLVPLAVPLLASPPAIFAAMSYTARFGEDTAAAAVACAILLAAAVLLAGQVIARGIGRIGVSTLGRLSGGLLMVVAVELAIDGVRSV